MKRSSGAKPAIEKGKDAIKFIRDLKAIRSDAELKKYHRFFDFKENARGSEETFIGVRMGQVFALAKKFVDLSPAEIEKLLESPIHEVRVGGVSIMDFQARDKKTAQERKKELFDLYIRRHDRINTWDLVDRSCIHVVGAYLLDKPRKILYKLVRSKQAFERRTAIVSTAYFIRQGDLDDVFRLSEMLLQDKDDLMHKATGWMLRYAGDKDRERLTRFLDQHAATMPRAALRNVLEHLTKKERERYLGMKARM